MISKEELQGALCCKDKRAWPMLTVFCSYLIVGETFYEENEKYM
jgi:hypothetical protein